MRPGTALFVGTQGRHSLRVVGAKRRVALEISRLLGIQPKTVQRIVDAFEEQGLIEGRVTFGSENGG